MTIHVSCIYIYMHAAMNCQYRYDIQPAPTSEICPLEGHPETALILKCRVSTENSTDLSIIWHHGRSTPDSSNIFDNKTIITNSFSTVINTTNTAKAMQTSLTSQLTLHGFDDKATGYYWCSVQVNSSSNVWQQNPSVILHIMHSFDVHCKANHDQTCDGDISLYNNTLPPSLRCADHEASVDILEAQRCPHLTTDSKVDENPTDTSFTSKPQDLPFSQKSTSPTTISPNTQPITQERASPSQLSMGVIIGAAMGGLVLILFIVIGLALICVMKKRRKHRTREHAIDAISPFDDIRMYSSIAKLTQEKVDDPNRISKLYCDPNAAYECPQTGASSQTENIYEFIH